MVSVFPSPDGRFSLEIFSVPMRMSHEVDCPTLYEAASRTILFDPGSLWDASDVHWSDDSNLLTMQIRHYDKGLKIFTLSLNIENRTAVLSSGDSAMFTGNFDQVERSMRVM